MAPTLIFLIATGILVAIIGNWNSWASEPAIAAMAVIITIITEFIAAPDVPPL